MTPDTPTQAAARLLALAKAAQKYTDEIGEGWFSADESHSLINKIDGALIAACDPQTITTICTALQEACAERDALRAALKPFADCTAEYMAGGIYEVYVSGNDLIAARAAISNARKEGA